MWARVIPVIAVLLFVGWSTDASVAAPLGTAITYQGQLKESGLPYGGAADLAFTLYDAAAGGAIVAGPVTLNAVSVVNGLFTVSLDFGASAFSGNACWLQIAVRAPAGSGSYTPLSPRQDLTPAPYALFSAGPWASSGGNVYRTSGNVGIGTTTPQTSLHILGGNWNVFASDGDLKIGNDSYRLRMGVALDGYGAGIARIHAVGGAASLRLGNGTTDTVIVQGNKVGLGGIDPTRTLDVGGDARVNGALTVTGSLSAPFVRKIKLTAESLGISSGLTREIATIRWPADPTLWVSAAVPMPEDWDGTSNFTLAVLFQSPSSGPAGVVDFRVQVAGYKTGDILFLPGFTYSTGVDVSGAYLTLFKQSISVPASQFATDDDMIWITIKRGGPQETYISYVYVMAVELSYGAKR
jgi:hypothetical protein